MELNRLRLLGLSLFSAGMVVAAAHPAAATSMKECGAQYQAAKAAGTLNGADWKTYRAANCASVAPSAATPSASAPAATVPVATTPPGKTAVAPVPAAAAVKPSDAAPVAVAKTAPAPVAAAPAAAGSAVFPDKIDPKYAALKAGSARRKTCDDQYKANKASNGNGGLSWNQKGGGYYSACNKHLKGA